jgi:hypothetical protein
MDKRQKPSTPHRNPQVHKLGQSNLGPFHQGLKDFYRGEISNPYKVNTQDHRDWQFGFNKSYFSNLERINGKTKEATS